MKSLQDALYACIWWMNFHMRHLDCLIKIVSPDGIRNGNALGRASSAPLVDGLPHTEWKVPIPCPTHDYRLQFEDLGLKMVQVRLYIDSSYQRNTMVRWPSL